MDKMNKFSYRKQIGLGHKFIRGAIALLFMLNVIGLPKWGAAQTLATGKEFSLPLLVKPAEGAFRPAIIEGLTLYKNDPLKFDFIVNLGDQRLGGQALVKEADKLIKYFMAALTIPENDLWVNLSPYAKDAIIPPVFGETILGRDMLAQDYILKQLTASLAHPENKFGFEFWKRVYAKAQEKFGTTDIPMTTFDRIWIVPAKAVVFQYEGSAYIVESRLKVLLDEDYRALKANVHNQNMGTDQVAEKKDIEDINEFSSKIMREVIVPEVEREVNESANFTQVRQIYHSLILAMWYKKNLKESLLGKIYINQNKTPGIDVSDKMIAYKIYNQYLDMFKEGAYNYIREDYNGETKDVIPRKYYSGGIMSFYGVSLGDIIEDLKKLKDLTDEQFIAFINDLNLADILEEKRVQLLAAIDERFVNQPELVLKLDDNVRMVLVTAGATAVEKKPDASAPVIVLSAVSVPIGSIAVGVGATIETPGDSDNAALTVLEQPAESVVPPGGIDFDPALLNLQVKKDKKGIPFPVSDQPLMKMKVDGLLPVILKIEPLMNYPTFSNMEEKNKKEKTPAKISGDLSKEQIHS